MPRRVRIVSTWIAALSLGVGAVLAAPPTDEQIDQAIRTYRSAFTAGAASHDTVTAAAKQAMAGLDVGEMTGMQIGRLAEHGSLLTEGGAWEAAKARLHELLPDRGPDGAAAAIRLLGSRLREAPDDDARIAILRDTIAHPGLEEAIRRGGASRSLGILSMEARALAPKLRPELASLDRLLTPEFAPILAPDFTSYYELHRTAASAGSATELEPLRQKLVTLARGALENPATDESMREFITTTADYLDGRYVKGQLLDQPAPQLTILWSTDPKITSLADLKGRVVVLDFWATWCGPCIESLPAVRELQARYKDFPVTILGVSSPQGSVIGLEKGKITKADSEQHEFDLMQQYVRVKEITWPLIFTRESVMNPDYGIRGIPHVVIIDPAGVVRHRALHPARPLAEKVAKIDDLLREFKLSAPAPLAKPADKPSGG